MLETNGENWQMDVLTQLNHLMWKKDKQIKFVLNSSPLKASEEDPATIYSLSSPPSSTIMQASNAEWIQYLFAIFSCYGNAKQSLRKQISSQII